MSRPATLTQPRVRRSYCAHWASPDRDDRPPSASPTTGAAARSGERPTRPITAVAEDMEEDRSCSTDVPWPPCLRLGSWSPRVTPAAQATGSPSAAAPTTAASEAASPAASEAASPSASAAPTDFAACGNEKNGDGPKIGGVTDVGQLEDKSFNEAGWCGTLKGATAVNGTAAVIVTKQPQDYAANIQTFIDQKFDTIVTYGFNLGTDDDQGRQGQPGHQVHRHRPVHLRRRERRLRRPAAYAKATPASSCPTIRA